MSHIPALSISCKLQRRGSSSTERTGMEAYRSPFGWDAVRDVLVHWQSDQVIPPKLYRKKPVIKIPLEA
jgi:hypothetical protein